MASCDKQAETRPESSIPLLRLESGFSCGTLARMPFGFTFQPRPNLRLSFTNRYNFGDFPLAELR